MLPSWLYWVVLALPLAGIGYLWQRERARRTEISGLSTELARRTADLDKAHQTLHRLAGVDALTSLANHSAFQEFLRGEWRRALREASSVSVLMVDIDRFTDYNDRLGHQAGDECLAKIGHTLKEAVRRPGDLAARYGGEEFAIVMSRTDQQGASRVAHRICAAVEALGIEHPESDVSRNVTVSVGVATATPAIDSNWEELQLVASAKVALGKAKHAGRNRVASADDDGLGTPPG